MNLVLDDLQAIANGGVTRFARLLKGGQYLKDGSLYNELDLAILRSGYSYKVSATRGRHCAYVDRAGMVINNVLAESLLAGYGRNLEVFIRKQGLAPLTIRIKHIEHILDVRHINNSYLADMRLMKSEFLARWFKAYDLKYFQYLIDSTPGTGAYIERASYAIDNSPDVQIDIAKMKAQNFVAYTVEFTRGE